MSGATERRDLTPAERAALGQEVHPEAWLERRDTVAWVAGVRHVSTIWQVWGPFRNQPDTRTQKGSGFTVQEAILDTRRRWARARGLPQTWAENAQTGG